MHRPQFSISPGLRCAAEMAELVALRECRKSRGDMSRTRKSASVFMEASAIGSAVVLCKGGFAKPR
jgi:hypothetical protein